jgi:hypothetical protein
MSMGRTNKNLRPPLADAAGSVISWLKYIAESPDRQSGGFHLNAVTTAKSALREIRRLRRAVRWALGENGNFAQRPPGAGAYWWRAELRRRSGMSPNTELRHGAKTHVV